MLSTIVSRARMLSGSICRHNCKSRMPDSARGFKTSFVRFETFFLENRLCLGGNEVLKKRLCACRITRSIGDESHDASGRINVARQNSDDGEFVLLEQERR